MIATLTLALALTLAPVPTEPDRPPPADTYAAADDTAAVQRYLDALHEIELFLHAHQVARWEATGLVWCEARGDWHAVSRSGTYRGGLQMNATFWATYGGLDFAARPELAEPWQQATVADRHLDDEGDYGAWPSCARRLGLPR
jgi:hypothetical protein